MDNNLVLIASTNDLKNRGLVHKNVQDGILLHSLKSAQDLFVHPILGDSLYSSIKTKVVANNLAGNYLTLVNDYIKDVIIYYAMADIVFDSTYQQAAKGTVKKSDDYADTVTMDDLQIISDRHKQKADHYAERLRVYLKNNESLFTELAATNEDLSPATSTAYSTSIYLRPDTDC